MEEVRGRPHHRPDARVVGERFVISAGGGKGSVWFSLVSLFPPTYNDRPNGNRIDLMEKLAAMQPEVPPLPRRQLPRGRHHRHPVRLEKDHRPARGPPRPPGVLELPRLRRAGAAGIPRLVRGPAHGAAAGGVRGVLAQGRARAPGRTSSRSCRTRWTRSSTSPATRRRPGARGGRRTGTPSRSRCITSRSATRTSSTSCTRTTAVSRRFLTRSRPSTPTSSASPRPR